MKGLDIPAAETYALPAENAIGSVKAPVGAIPSAVVTVDTAVLRAALTKFARIVPTKFSRSILHGIMVTAEEFASQYFSKNCAGVSISGRSKSMSSKSLSPVTKTSTSSVMAEYSTG